jgi:hypothetical protein
VILQRQQKIGVGDGVRGGILTDYGAHIIGDLHHILDVMRQHIVVERKMTGKPLTQLQNRVKDTRVGSTSVKVDHKKAANSYKYRYGDTWKDEIIEFRAFKKVRCIAMMVIHMAEETEKAMIGTKHEDDWYFYHDAISQMTCHKNKDWMQETGYIRQWILPLNQLNG